MSYCNLSHEELEYLKILGEYKIQNNDYKIEPNALQNTFELIEELFSTNISAKQAIFTQADMKGLELIYDELSEYRRQYFKKSEEQYKRENLLYKRILRKFITMMKNLKDNIHYKMITLSLRLKGIEYYETYDGITVMTNDVNNNKFVNGLFNFDKKEGEIQNVQDYRN